MDERKKLSELEACVLGLLWADGPCTAYAIRRVFQGSLSPHWSGSAGAIYPLFDRLERRGLIHSQPHAKGRRASKRFSLSAEGLSALRSWLKPPVPDWAIGLPVDPLRIRLRFLGALPPRQRASALADLTRRTEEHLRVIEADCRRCQEGDDPYQYAMALGALHMIRARRDWVTEVAKVLQTTESRRGRAASAEQATT